MPYYQWNDLVVICRRCQRCVLSETCSSTVLGRGNKTASILLVSDVPLQGEGLGLLEDLLSLGELWADCYLTSLVKCVPPQGRTPLYTQEETCLPHLRNQFLLLKPKVVVCLGERVAQRLIRPDYQLSTAQGQPVEKNGVSFFAIPHPRTLLQCPELRAECYEQLKKLGETGRGAVAT